MTPRLLASLVGDVVSVDSFRRAHPALVVVGRLLSTYRAARSAAMSLTAPAIAAIVPATIASFFQLSLDTFPPPFGRVSR